MRSSEMDRSTDPPVVEVKGRCYGLFLVISCESRFGLKCELSIYFRAHVCSVRGIDLVREKT